MAKKESVVEKTAPKVSSGASSTGAHIRELNRKIRKFEKKGWNASGLKKELDFCTGRNTRPTFRTGIDASIKKTRILPKLAKDHQDTGD